MGSPTFAVNSAVAQFSPPGMHLPIGAKRTLPFFNFLHRIWTHWRRGQLYTNHFGKMLAGHALNAALGDSRWLQIAAQCVLIAQRILACIDQQVKVCRSCHKLVDAFFNRYPTAISRKWSKETSVLFSPSSTHWWREFFIMIFNYLKILIWRIIRIVYHFFKLSMRTLDAIESFSFTPEKGYQAITELFVNTSDCIDKCAENGQRILNLLKEHKSIISSVLSCFGSSWSVDHLIESASKHVNSLHGVNQSVQTIDASLETVASDIGKQGLFGLASAFGVSRVLPDTLVPPVAPASPILTAPIGKIFGRFAPVVSIGKMTNAKALLREREVDLNSLPVSKSPLKGLQFKAISLEKIHAKYRASQQSSAEKLVIKDQGV